MSRALRTIAVVAGGVALIVGTAGLLAPAVVAGSAAAAAGATVTAGGVLGISAATLGTIATVATLTATAASIGAQLTAPKPIARGSPATLTIDVEPPRPYIVGRVMVGGVLRHDVAYGPTIAKVPNPYRWQVRVLSGVGPIQGIVGEFFDFEPLGGFYTGFYATTQNLGDRPQATALVPTYGTAPGWDATSKLSGCAHVGLNFLFDRDGKRFASGLPIYTALCDGEKVYDPRQDSTFPGGSGPCRAGVESTYVYSANPACHAVTYALGRFQNGQRIFGLGQAVDTIDLPAIVDWANDCDANGWTANLVLTEGGTSANLREQRVRNLDDLCAAGGGRWYQAGGLLSFDWHRPRLSLATLTDEDILEAGGGTDAVQTVRDRMNGVRPQYVSPEHNWQQITAAEIVGTTYRTEDGAPLTQVYPLNGVTNPEQAGELAAYAMADSRELGPMDMQAKAKWRFYRPGDCLTIDSSLVAYSGQAIINQRSLNPDTLAVALSFKSETPGKHPFALGKVATPPPTPILAQTPEERDLLAAATIIPRAVDVEFDDGRTVEELQPGEGGSTRNVPRGTYDAGTTYTRGDSVLFNGSAYQLIVASSVGNAPPDVARWALTATTGTGVPGDDGPPGLTIIVSNEAHVVATAADGSGGNYSAAGGQMRLLRGETLLMPTFSVPARTPNTSWITIDSNGNYTVTDPGVDLATATLRAVNAGINYDRTYTLAKSKQGVTGPRLALAVDNQAFTFTDGAANPGSQTVTIEALLNNLSGTATFTTTPAVTLGGTGNTRTLSVANFGTNRQVTVQATLGGITDRITIVRLERDVTAPGNSNRVPLSRMEGDSGYGVLFNPASLAVTTNYGVFQAQRFFRVLATATASAQQISIGHAPATVPTFRLNPSERVSVQARVEAQGVSAPTPDGWTLVLWGFKADGSQLTIGTVSGVGARFIGSGPVQFFVDVPSDVIGGRLELYGFSGGAGVLQVVISEPMVTSAAAGQTVHPPFSPGPVLTGALDAGGPLFVGQLPAPRVEYSTGDTVEDLKPAEAGSDITATAQRSIEPQFPAIEVKQGEPGHTGNRTVTHVAKRALETLTGGTWSIPSTNLFGGSATINASTGTVTISGIVQSGAYVVRYTHTDGLATDLPVNVSYVPAVIAGLSNSAFSTARGLVNASSFVAISGELSLAVSSGATTVALTASNITLEIPAASPAGATNVEVRWERETSPGTWGAVGAVAAGSPQPTVIDEGEGLFSSNPGAVTCNRTATGLTAGSTQKFRLAARISGGVSRTVTPTGTVSAVS